MKLPGMLRPANTADKLTATRNLLAAAEARIEKLQSDRTAALSGDDSDISVVSRIDTEIAATRTIIAAHQDRIAVLETRIADDQDEQAKRDQQAWIDRIEALLPKRARAAAELEAAIAAVGVAVQKYRAATAAIGAAWKSDLNLLCPFDVVGAGSLIQRAFQPSPYLRDPKSGRPPDLHAPM